MPVVAAAETPGTVMAVGVLSCWACSNSSSSSSISAAVSARSRGVFALCCPASSLPEFLAADRSEGRSARVALPALRLGKASGLIPICGLASEIAPPAGPLLIPWPRRPSAPGPRSPLPPGLPRPPRCIPALPAPKPLPAPMPSRHVPRLILRQGRGLYRRARRHRYHRLLLPSPLKALR